MKRSAALPLAVLLVFAAGCGDDETTTVADGGNRSGLVVRVERTGGFVTPEMTFAEVPLVSIYGDGRALTPGAMIEIYPGPAYVPLSETSVDQQVLADLLAEAEERNLAGEQLDYGQPPIADAPDTVVTIVTVEGTFEQRANALDAGFGTDQAALSEEQQRNREHLVEFVRAAEQAASPRDADAVEYEPSAFRVRAERQEPRAADPGSGEPEPRLRDWPTDLPELSSIGACSVFDGASARQLGDLFRDADQLTYFTDAEGTWRVTIRPLLPDESGC